MDMENHDNFENITHHNNNLKIAATAGKVSIVDEKDEAVKFFHEDVEIKLFYKGNSTLLVGGKTVMTAPGDIVVINPYEFHSTIDIGKMCGMYHLLMISLDFFDGEKGKLSDLRQIFIGEQTSIQTLIKGDVRLRRIITDIMTEYTEKGEMHEEVIKGLMLELFSLLLRKYKNVDKLDYPTDKNIKYYKMIYPAIKRIRKDYATQLSVDALAAECNISKYHFCRIFKSATSMSVVQYHNQYRLQIAEVLIQENKRSITEIAHFCGFDDVCYFSRCYKKYYGVSPKNKRAILSK